MGLVGSLIVWGNKLYELFNTGSIVSRTDIFLSIVLAGICFKLYTRISKMAKETDDKLKKQYDKITLEYTKEIESHIKYLAQEISSTKENIKNINSAISSINSNIIEIAKSK